MRIALVGARCYPPRHGGLEVVVAELAHAFAKLGNEVDLFASEFDDDVATNQLGLHGVSALGGKYSKTLSQAIASRDAVKSTNPDVVAIHGVGPAIPLVLSRRFFGNAPTVVTCHGADWRRDKWPRIARKAFRYSAGAAIRRADKVTAVSAGCASDIAFDVGISPQVIPNGVAIPGDMDARLRIDAPSGYSVVVSRLTPEKRVDLLVEAYDAEVSNLLGPLVVIGSGASSHTELHEKRVRSLAHESTVFTGRLDRTDTLAVVKGASRYISVSRFEAQPMAVLEAMALGVPLHLSDIPAHRELCGNAASYFASLTPDQLKNHLIDSGSRPRQDLIVSEAKEIADNRQWDRIARRYIEVYEDAINLRVCHAD